MLSNHTAFVPICRSKSLFCLQVKITTRKWPKWSRIRRFS